MDALTQQTNELSLTAAAAAGDAPASSSSGAASVAFLLHVLDMSSVTEDAPIELNEDAENYIALRWSAQELAEASTGAGSGSTGSSAEGLTVAQVKHELARARYLAAQNREDEEENVAAGAASTAAASTSTASAADAPASEKKANAPLHLDDMRLVYLTQRGVSASSGAALSTCRPLTDLGARSSLQQLGVASGSWVLLKRRFVPTRQVEEEDDEEEQYEQYEDEQEEYEDEAENQEEPQPVEQAPQQQNPSAEESTTAGVAVDTASSSSTAAPVDASAVAPSSSIDTAAASAT